MDPVKEELEDAVVRTGEATETGVSRAETEAAAIAKNGKKRHTIRRAGKYIMLSLGSIELSVIESDSSREANESLGYRLTWQLDGELKCIHLGRMNNTISIRLPEEANRKLEERVRKTGLSRSTIVKEALERSFQSEPKAFMALAGSIEGDPSLSKRKGFAETCSSV